MDTFAWIILALLGLSAIGVAVYLTRPKATIPQAPPKIKPLEKTTTRRK